jgi:inner membrane protein
LDNITHSLVGLLVGESAAWVAVRARGRAPAAAPAPPGALPAVTLRNLLVVEMVVGSNLPDIDIGYSMVSGDPLAYLLQHRGYTHTLVGVAVLALCIWGASALWLRARGLKTREFEALWIGGVALLGPLLHLAMDYTNSYGVHPYWPLDGRWIYGDSVFIMEPLMWAAAAPLVFLLRTWVARALVAAALALAVGLSVGFGLALWPSSVALLLLIGTLLAIGRWLRPGPALACGLALWGGITLVFLAAGRSAARQAEAYATTHFPRAQLLDHVLTPMPENPLCWELLLLQVEGERYSIRRALLSLAPVVLPAARCPSRSLQGPSLVPLAKVPDAGSPGLAWYGELDMPRASLAQLAATYCRAAAFLRFARAPWESEHGPLPLIGDLRFASGSRTGFAEFELERGAACPKLVPSWQPPRIELLRGVPAAASAAVPRP